MSDAAARVAILQQPRISADDLMKIWEFYDNDGNGYIEGKELEDFFRELEQARRGAGEDSESFRESMKEFMEKFDQNSDGRIELAELAQILPTEENFLLFFRQHVKSSAEFMEIWRRYDSDRSGFIEANELKDFLKDLLKKANREFDEKKLNEYTQTTLKMFDSNRDGKLELSEMARLLPVQENFLLKFQGVTMTAKEFNDIFTFYDKDRNGYIDEDELEALLRDLHEKNRKDLDAQTLTSYKRNIMALSDHGKLYRNDLEMVLCVESL
ncbi:calretinin-like isoform X1 [Petromyzon marinus]|uniref:Calretinin-like isoform X1 n=3 Tax=Petromyzon marinus TaxID=7757 RepID=A0AAJ7T958_PETMA|nr:calretinin-like isoform X1 [Petromyzon marinus]XP_061421693.1 calretinin isoform X1 [Lethenteron reissneri]